MQKCKFCIKNFKRTQNYNVCMLGSTLHFTHFNYETRNKLSSLPLASEKYTKKKLNEIKKEMNIQHNIIINYVNFLLFYFF